MSNKQRPWILGVLLCLVFAACEADKSSFVFLEGKALGVMYSISYRGEPSISRQIDSIILVFDATVNIERPDSEISTFNRDGFVELSSDLLSEMILTSMHYYRISRGAVNHCILPLIHAWGREFGNKREMHSDKIDSLKMLCNPEYIEIGDNYIRTSIPGSKIDLNYLDKGYLIDNLSDFLMDRGVKDFHIEFGTDLISFGKNFKNATHNLVVNFPDLAGNLKNAELKTSLKNAAYSSSGNYEKFYVDETGAKHSHLIDPRTGYPIKNGLLSTHIKSKKCLQADALATICMILSLEESMALIQNLPGVEAFFVYSESGEFATWKTPGF
ncbi:MAG: FAD:protein FMN transferase [Cyclobacteriaceae bacterium]|nr:FAD:protein FMN transferase [Cyclobacteriaceae bacterium]